MFLFSANFQIEIGALQSTSEQYEHMKNELSKLRFENERLQRRKDELELFVEQIKLKEGFGIGNGEREYKVAFVFGLKF